MPLTGIAAAGIAAGATLAGGTAGIIANSNMNKKNRKWQEKMTKEARTWQEKMYNQYNSPQAQAQQLAAAGVNPYNQGGASTTPMSTSTSVPSPSSTPYDFGFVGDAADKAIGHIQNAPVLKAQALANDKTELEIESQKIQIRRDLMAEIREAIDTGNYEQAATLNLQLISETLEDTKESRKVKIATRNKLQQEFDNLVEDHKEKVRNNQLGDQAAAAGVNPAIDDHNLTIAQINALNVDSADKHAMHQLSYEIAKDSQKNNATILKAYAIKEAQKTNINSLFNVDYDTLPSYLKNELNILYSLVHDVADGKVEQSVYATAKKEFDKQYESWVTNEENRSNPNYQSDAEKTRLFYEFVNTGLGGSAKMLDIFGKSN